MARAEPVLEARNLKKYFDQRTSLIESAFGGEPPKIQAVDDVTLTLHENESLGVIGESGCGKTTLLKTLIGLYEPTDGEIRYRGDDIVGAGRAAMKAFRSNVQIIFQDPYNTLNPKMTVRSSLMEPLRIHGFDEKERRLHETMEEVELNPPERYLDRLPAQLSGGEKQRASIARALIIEPDVILADEPVSMLDVSTQASILKLLQKLRRDRDLALLYISHDLSTVAHICDAINVMYLGRIVERGETIDLIQDPRHPYSQALINSIPTPNPHDKRARTDIEGSPRDPIDIGEGCRFRDRCPERMEVCEVTPRFAEHGDRRVACHLYYDHEGAPGAAESGAVAGGVGGDE